MCAAINSASGSTTVNNNFNYDICIEQMKWEAHVIAEVRLAFAVQIDYKIVQNISTKYKLFLNNNCNMHNIVSLCPIE